MNMKGKRLSVYKFDGVSSLLKWSFVMKNKCGQWAC